MMKAIVCIDANGGIGNDKDLLFHFSQDMKRFKKLTENQIVIMGRKTFETFNNPLKNRINLVVTSQKALSTPGCVYGTKEEILNFLNSPAATGKEVWVIGGAEIYNLFKEEISHWEITYVPEIVESNVKITDLIKDIRCNWAIANFETVIDIDKKTNQEKTFYFETYYR